MEFLKDLILLWVPGTLMMAPWWTPQGILKLPWAWKRGLASPVGFHLNGGKSGLFIPSCVLNPPATKHSCHWSVVLSSWLRIPHWSPFLFLILLCHIIPRPFMLIPYIALLLSMVFPHLFWDTITGPYGTVPCIGYIWGARDGSFSQFPDGYSMGQIRNHCL